MPTTKPDRIELTEDELLADIRAAMQGAERPDGYYTVSEWAARLGLPVSTVGRNLRGGMLGYRIDKREGVMVQAGGKTIKTTVYSIEAL